MAHRAGALSGSPTRPAHAQAGDEGLGLGLAGQLSELAEATASGDSPYWLVPFENYKTMCPYLVGSYERGGEEVSRYIAVGDRSFILDIPPTQEDLHHTSHALRPASTLVTR